MNKYVILVVSLMLVVSQNRSSVSSVLESETLQLDLRNELDMVTKDLITRGLIEDTRAYHSYVFHSGIGNREELKVTSFTQNDAFAIGDEVEEWETIASGGNIYMLGRTSKAVILTVASQRLSPNKTIYLSSHTIEKPVNTVVTASSMFEKWNQQNKRMEVILAIAINSTTSDILWFSINSTKIERFWSWSRYKPISCMVVFTIGNRLNLITINTGKKNQPTAADVYDIDIQKLDFRLSHSLLLDESSSSVDIGIVGKEIYLFIPQTKLGILLVFKYYPLSIDSEHGFFQHNINISSPGVTRTHSFTTASQMFLAVNGKSPSIYKIQYSGGFVKDLHTYLDEVEDWVIIPVDTYRNEVILLATYKKDVKLIIWKGVDKGFSEGRLTEIDPFTGSRSSCLEGSFSGAVAVPFHNTPSILLPKYSNHSMLCHIIAFLDDVKDPINSEMFHLNESRIFIEDVWNRQRQAEKEIKHKLTQSIKKNETNKISSKWIVKSLETPALIESRKVAHSRTYSTQSNSTTEKSDLISIKEKISYNVAEINKLKAEVQVGENSYWDLKKFHGRVVVKGIVRIQYLTLFFLNYKNVNKILFDSLRWDKPSKISGIKNVFQIEAESVKFEKLNSFNASQLNYADKSINLHGDVTFQQKLSVKDSIYFRKGGLVNNINLSEDLCRVNESCPAVFKFENLTVKNSIIAENLNDEYLERIKQKKPTNSVSVFTGKSFYTSNINGKNLLDIMDKIVYTDRDMDIPETTVVRGTVFSQDDILLASLIDESTPSENIPTFKTSESNTIDDKTPKSLFNNPIVESVEPIARQGSTNSPSSAIRSQKIEVDLLPKVTLINADVIFSSVEVLGKVSSDEVLGSRSWADDMAQILLSEVEAEVSGIKTFKNTLNISKDFQVNGNVSGINISQLLTTDTDQILNGVRTFHGNVTFGNMTLTGNWDEVNVTKLDKDAVRLSVDQFLPSLQLVFNGSILNIEAQNVTIMHAINDMNLKDIFTDEKIKRHFEFSSLSVTNCTVLGNIYIQGKICGWNLNELGEKRFSLTQDQNITGNFNFQEIIITDVLEVQQLNGLNISNLNNVLQTLVSNFNYSEAIISELYVYGTISTEKGVAGYNLTAIAKDAILLAGNNIIKSHLVFEDLLSCEILDIHNTVGGQNWTFFTEDAVYKDEEPVFIEGMKTFNLGFLITDDFEVNEINNQKIKDILTTFTEQNISGDVQILGDLFVNMEANIFGTVNEKNISEIASRCYIPDKLDSIFCTGDVNFESDVYINNLEVGGSVNFINFTDYISSVVYKNSTSVINGTKTFTGVVQLSDVTLSYLNGQEFNKFLENIVLMEPEVDVYQHVTFTKDVKVMGSIIVDYNLDVPTVYSYNLKEWSHKAVYLDKNMTISGLKYFKSASSTGNITTHFFGNVDMTGGSIILLKKRQVLTGTLKFEKLTSIGNVPVGRKVNNARLDELFKNTLMKNRNQVIESDIMFKEDIVIEGNLTTLGNVNGKDLKKVVTLHTNQSLSGNYNFYCLIITNNINSSGLISGINITDWKQRAVMLDTDQEVSGSWWIEDSVHFTHPVKGLLNLGDINLQNLQDKIKTHVLDVELEMKVNLTSLCNSTNVLIEKAYQEEISLSYFEYAQQIEMTPLPFKIHYFQAYDENYLLISKWNCTCYLFKWNRKTLQFRLMYEENINYFTQLVLLEHDHVNYIITLSLKTNFCQNQGLNIWLFSNNSLQHMLWIQSNATDIIGDVNLQNVFYTLESSNVRKWLLNSSDIGLVVVPQHQEWIINVTGNTRFLDSSAGLGLTVSNGSHLFSVLPLNILPEKFNNNLSKEISSNHAFFAVASWEESEVKRRSDFVKIYKINGMLYDKVLTNRPSQLNWFSLQDTIYLAFIENSTILQVYQHQGVLKGFQQKLSVNLQYSGLKVLLLPLEGKWNKHPYLFLFSNSSIQLIESSIFGDPYRGPNLFCHFEHLVN